MTGKEKVLSVLEDGQWHSYFELLEVYFKYTSRIFDLKKDGYIFEERQNAHNKHALDYRLVKEPIEKEKPEILPLDERVELASKIEIPEIEKERLLL